uniref:Uncharacterized protein n=1 Tax=Tanacetum cinerariifolium TaxID=118510 RepID=A0A699UEK8_TANCI|nr:hypothetical protein [Tanacetum cinerariifolium]
MEAEDQEIIKSMNETPAQKAAKRRKLSEEAPKAEDLKKRLEVVEDEDDDVFVEATPLANGQYAIWRNQKSVHDLSLVKKMEAAGFMWCSCHYSFNSSALLIG